VEDRLDVVAFRIKHKGAARGAGRAAPLARRQTPVTENQPPGGSPVPFVASVVVVIASPMTVMGRVCGLRKPSEEGEERC